MKTAVKVSVVLLAVVAVGCCIVLHRDLRLEKQRVAQSSERASQAISQAEDLRHLVVKLESERDKARADLKAAAEALGIEQSSESVELTVFREKLSEVEKRLERAKIDRDNLANELAEEKRDRDQLADAYAALQETVAGKNDILERRWDEMVGLRHEIDCQAEELARLRTALKRAPNCCECHTRYAVHSHTANPKKHRRHK